MKIMLYYSKIVFYNKAKCRDKVGLEVLGHRLLIKETEIFKAILEIKDHKIWLRMSKLKLI